MRKSWSRSVVGMLGLVGALAGLASTGCATARASAADPWVLAQAEQCQHGCSCEQQCELDWSTCSAPNGTCTTELSLCHQRCSVTGDASVATAGTYQPDSLNH